MAADTFVLPDGTEFLMGCLPMPAAVPQGNWPVYGDLPHTKKVDRSDWTPIDFSHLCSPIKDQDGAGACNLFTTIECIEGTRRAQGLPDVRLAPGWGYGQLCPNPPQGGTYLEEAIRFAMEKGAPPVSVIPELDYRSRPPAAATAALSYRCLSAAWCETPDLLVSAIIQGRFTNVGLTWFAEDNPGPDGWLPTRGRSVGGHSVTGCGLVIEGNRVGILIANHYTPRWGRAGFGIIPLERLERDRGVGGMWAMWGVVDEGGVVPQPQEG